MSLKIVEEIGKMSVLELADLIKEIENKFGVSAVAAVPAAAAPAAAAPAAVEKTEFKVTLKSGGTDKIKVIKALREVTSLGLKEAKEAVDGAPTIIAESASKDDANKMKEKLEAAGAAVELA